MKAEVGLRIGWQKSEQAANEHSPEEIDMDINRSH